MQVGYLGRNMPLVRIGQLAPAVHVGPNLIDDRGRIIFLLGGRQRVAAVEDHLGLVFGPPALPGLGNRRDQLRAPARFHNPVGRLAVCIQLPVPARVLVRRIENRTLEERVGHAPPRPTWPQPPPPC